MYIQLDNFRVAAQLAASKLARNGYKDCYVEFSNLSYIAEADEDKSNDYTVEFRCAKTSEGKDQINIEVLICGDTVILTSHLADIIVALALKEFDGVAVY